MNKKILFAVPLGWLLASCATPQMNGECMPYTMPGTCSGNPQAPAVNLNTNSLNATPGCVDADPGTTLVFMLTPRGGKKRGTVEIFPKKPAEAPWLAAKNDENEDFIFVKIPAGVDLDDYDYGIRTSSKCVDPRVRVR